MNVPELLPCPFCGTTPHVWGVQNFPALESIGCANDDCKVQPSTDYLPDDQAVASWNRRLMEPSHHHNQRRYPMTAPELFSLSPEKQSVADNANRAPRWDTEKDQMAKTYTEAEVQSLIADAVAKAIAKAEHDVWLALKHSSSITCSWACRAVRDSHKPGVK